MRVYLEEAFEKIVADEAIWNAQFAATDDDKLAALVASVEAEINADKTLPMFDERGEFIEHLTCRSGRILFRPSIVLDLNKIVPR